MCNSWAEQSAKFRNNRYTCWRINQWAVVHSPVFGSVLLANTLKVIVVFGRQSGCFRSISFSPSAFPLAPISYKACAIKSRVPSGSWSWFWLSEMNVWIRHLGEALVCWLLMSPPGKLGWIKGWRTQAWPFMPDSPARAVIEVRIQHWGKPALTSTAALFDAAHWKLD